MNKIIVFFTLLLLSINVHATDTKIIVRAKSKDAKFIGSSLGGAYIIIRNKVNNSVLAEGKTEGTPGNTDLIMKTNRERYELYSDESSAKFLATIDINEPTFVRIEVVSPYNHRQSQVHAATELWLIPGKHILGDGIIVEIPGFIVDVLSPRTHNFIQLSSIKDKPFKIQANVVMMCGCIITKGGVWNSEEMEVAAIVKRNGTILKTVRMQLTTPNLFEGELSITEKGDYEFSVYAYSEKTGNTGVDKVNFVVY